MSSFRNLRPMFLLHTQFLSTLITRVYQYYSRIFLLTL